MKGLFSISVGMKTLHLRCQIIQMLQLSQWCQVDLMTFQLNCYFVDNAKLSSGCMVDVEMHYSLCDKAVQNKGIRL